MKKTVLVLSLLALLHYEGMSGKRFGEHYAGISYLIQKEGNWFTIPSPSIWGTIKNCNWTRTKIGSEPEAIVTNGRVNKEFQDHFTVFEYSDFRKPTCLLELFNADVHDTAKYECQLNFNNETEVRGRFLQLFIQGKNSISERVGHIQEADHAVLLYKNVDVNQKDLYIPDLSIQEIELQCVSNNKIQLIHVSWKEPSFLNRKTSDTENDDTIFKKVSEEDLKRGDYSVECPMQPDNLHLSTKLVFPHPVRTVEMKVMNSSDFSHFEAECIDDGYPYPRNFIWTFESCIKDEFISTVYSHDKYQPFQLRPGIYSVKAQNDLNNFDDTWIESNKYRYCPDMN